MEEEEEAEEGTSLLPRPPRLPRLPLPPARPHGALSHEARGMYLKRLCGWTYYHSTHYEGACRQRGPM
jgi:hypothetical protein